jgi:hypothetical protein
MHVSVLAMLVLMALLAFAGVARAGPDPYLCDMTTARGAIPNSFSAQGCFDGRTLTISNNLGIPMSVQVRGDVGKPTRTETDYGIAADATRAVSSDTRILLPGDTLRFPIGTGAAEVRLTGGRYADFYELASTVAGFLPGGASGEVQAVTAFVKELNEDFRKYHECEGKARHNFFRRAGCHVIFVRNVGFAIGRAGVTGLARGALGAIISTATFDKWFSASVGNLKALIHSGTIRIGAVPATGPAPTPTQSVDLLEASALATFTGHIANDERCGGPEAAPNSCQLSGITMGTTSFRAAWWTAGYDTSDAITFNLGGRFRELSGVLGIVSVSGSGCEERFEITGDSHQLLGTDLTGVREVHINVAGVQVVVVSATIVEAGESDCQAGFGGPTGTV